MTSAPNTSGLSTAARSAADIGLDPFYPIVPDTEWLRRLLPLGIKTVQLRLKDASATKVRKQVGDSIALCQDHECTLIVNDYWAEAIELGAGFVHLGQEDLAAADLQAIKSAKIRLGVSTHSLQELEIALGADPDYVALGPIYETKLKVMKWAPQGLEKLGVWRQKIGGLPLVGIAGLTIERADGVIDAGAQSAAVITDFLTHDDPETRVRQWLDWAATRREPLSAIEG